MYAFLERWLPDILSLHRRSHTHVHTHRHTSWTKRTNVECKLVDLLTHNWSSKCQCNRSLLANSGEVAVNGGAAENWIRSRDYRSASVARVFSMILSNGIDQPRLFPETIQYLILVHFTVLQSLTLMFKISICHLYPRMCVLYVDH